MINNETTITAVLLSLFVVQLIAAMGLVTRSWFARRWGLTPRAAEKLNETWQFFVTYVLIISAIGALVITALL